MKKIAYLLLTMMVLLSFSLPVYAAGSTAQDQDQDYGVLIDYQEIVHDDGTFSRQYTYKKSETHALRSGSSTETMSGTDTFTKRDEGYQANYGPLLYTYEVTATFDWDKNKKTVNVRNASGKLSNIRQDKSTYTNKMTTTKGSGTKKASATYSFTRTLGTANRKAITVSCDYKGKNS